MKNTDLDKWIAEHIMEWNTRERSYCYFVDTKRIIHIEDWNPTESIEQVFQVVEKMIENDEILMCGLEYDGHRQQWRFALRKYDEIIVADFWPWADTKELAICLACYECLKGEKEHGSSME